MATFRGAGVSDETLGISQEGGRGGGGGGARGGRVFDDVFDRLFHDVFTSTTAWELVPVRFWTFSLCACIHGLGRGRWRSRGGNCEWMGEGLAGGVKTLVSSYISSALERYSSRWARAGKRFVRKRRKTKHPKKRKKLRGVLLHARQMVLPGISSFTTHLNLPAQTEFSVNLFSWSHWVPLTAMLLSAREGTPRCRTLTSVTPSFLFFHFSPCHC